MAKFFSLSEQRDSPLSRPARSAWHPRGGTPPKLRRCCVRQDLANCESPYYNLSVDFALLVQHHHHDARCSPLLGGGHHGRARRRVRQHHVDSRTRVSSSSSSTRTPHHTALIRVNVTVTLTVNITIVIRARMHSLQHARDKAGSHMYVAIAVCTDAHCGCVAMSAGTTLCCVTCVGLWGCDSKLALRGI
jgi:hypothetical protein